MELTKKELDVLRIIVEKELESMQKDAEKVTISNANYITKVETDSDLEFLKQVELYETFLKDLLNKLKND